MKKGDIVVYIGDYGFLNLTKYKKYKIINSGIWFSIIDDNDEIVHIGKSCFITVEQHRNNKLKELLNGRDICNL